MAVVTGDTGRLNIEIVRWGKMTRVSVEQPAQRDIECLAGHRMFNLFDLEARMRNTERPRTDKCEDYRFTVPCSDSLFAHRTTRVMKMLSVPRTVSLPLPVISGLCGMNLSRSLQERRVASVFILLFASGISGAMLLYFRLRWLV